MNRYEIYQELKKACAKGEAYVHIGRAAEPAMRERFKGLGALEFTAPGALEGFLGPILLGDYDFHQEVADVLMLMSHAHGWWQYWDIDGHLLSKRDEPERIGYRITGNREFWFRELCGYAHLPVFPVDWLREKIDLWQLENLPAVLLEQLQERDEVWSYVMAPELQGPLCYEQGFAIVRDGLPVYSYATLEA